MEVKPNIVVTSFKRDQITLCPPYFTEQIQR